ncbi:Uncharacterised protein [Mycobacterium tuberculosis]|uniref:Uncharacterized protein n=1 Tax=Mycobacterium tuberculosis TaxID=1773 RepID=A0A916LDW0_MYCTX|nr:Uncharacterised protein [Mycobacterium tuberculosis]COZ16526.1 Uncharacterised protein [Mycobacterium tuberculosis]COZ25977.1 Uncharacterised protein [Mycobacterium tuberculosis]
MPSRNASTKVEAISAAFSYVGCSEKPIHDSVMFQFRKL